MSDPKNLNWQSVGLKDDAFQFERRSIDYIDIWLAYSDAKLWLSTNCVSQTDSLMLPCTKIRQTLVPRRNGTYQANSIDAYYGISLAIVDETDAMHFRLVFC
jgi:hypothetical protein